jgi:hypothetical protein
MPIFCHQLTGCHDLSIPSKIRSHVQQSVSFVGLDDGSFGQFLFKKASFKKAAEFPKAGNSALPLKNLCENFARRAFGSGGLRPAPRIQHARLKPAEAWLKPASVRL